jgi:hypothetical protein
MNTRVGWPGWPSGGGLLLQAGKKIMGSHSKRLILVAAVI